LCGRREFSGLAELLDEEEALEFELELELDSTPELEPGSELGAS